MRNTLLAVLTAGVLTTGAAWHGLAADTQKAATITTPITHAIAGGRDSYADIVGVAAPAVVTIRTEGKAKMMPLARRRLKFGVTPISFWFAQDKALTRTKAGSRATPVP